MYSVSGKEISYQDLSTAEVFGELSAIDDRPRSANVVAMEQSTIGNLPQQSFREIVQTHPQVAEAVMRRLVSMVRFLCDRVYQYGALDVKDRVRVEIVRLARDHVNDDDSAVIEDMPTHSEIASRTNTHREAVTRELNELSRMDLISQKKRVLTVKNLGKLAELLPEHI